MCFQGLCNLYILIHLAAILCIKIFISFWNDRARLLDWIQQALSALLAWELSASLLLHCLCDLSVKLLVKCRVLVQSLDMMLTVICHIDWYVLLGTLCIDHVRIREGSSDDPIRPVKVILEHYGCTCFRSTCSRSPLLPKNEYFKLLRGLDWRQSTPFYSFRDHCNLLQALRSHGRGTTGL